ncbi:Thymidine kinase [Astathelohania contejeani]|uniref:Thymidine kinase n=1 Tax=Astathelohania contejeani TaxID=164912 RepID=A0ABQ7HXC4_9MICR|nr:Thymidine kinase [Thelohania contejeani]
MSQLIFRYGTVSSTKTLGLLAIAHANKRQGKNTMLMKPDIDTRYAIDVIKSRAGVEATVHCVITKQTDLVKDVSYDNVEIVLVDEAQFLSPRHINQLREVTMKHAIIVICFGLKADFKGQLFPGSKRLFELSDEIEEIKSTCHFCLSKSSQNLKHNDGKPVVDGDSIEIGSEELYLPVCFKCYYNKTGNLDLNK